MPTTHGRAVATTGPSAVMCSSTGEPMETQASSAEIARARASMTPTAARTRGRGERPSR